jgi:hypothetical protein
MPRKYLLEMLCDWRSFTKAPKNWKPELRQDMILHPQTRSAIEQVFGVSREAATAPDSEPAACEPW